MSNIAAEQTHLHAETKKLERGFAPAESTSATSYPARFFNQWAANSQLEEFKEASALAQTAGLEKPRFDNQLYDISLKRKQEQELFNFESWIEENFDTSDPNVLRLLEEMYPEYRGKREAYITERYELAKQYELLQLRGPRSKDDLVLQYMLSAGMVAAPQLVVAGDTNKLAGEAAVKRGLGNINGWLSQTADGKPRAPHVRKLGAGPTNNGALKLPPVTFQPPNIAKRHAELPKAVNAIAESKDPGKEAVAQLGKAVAQLGEPMEVEKTGDS